MSSVQEPGRRTNSYDDAHAFIEMQCNLILIEADLLQGTAFKNLAAEILW